MRSCPLLVRHLNVDALPSWPVTWGVPIEKGTLPKNAALAVEADGRLLPTQHRVLAQHDDGSVRQLVVTAEPALAGNTEHHFALVAADAPNPDQPAQLLSGAAGSASIARDQLKLTTPAGVFDAALNLQCEAGALQLRLDEPETLEDGPVMTTALIRGQFVHHDEALLHLRLTLRFFAVTSAIFCEVWLKNLSDREQVAVNEFNMTVKRSAAWHQAAFEVRQVLGERFTEPPVEVRSKGLAIEITPDDQAGVAAGRLLNYNETWLTATDEQSALTLALPNFFELSPYSFALQGDTLRIDFWPGWSERPWIIRQGSGKTHRIMLAPTQAGDAKIIGRTLGYAFCKPPMPRVPLDAMQKAGVHRDLMPYAPDDYPRFETTLYDLTYNRNRGYGKMHWGDDYSALYSNQKRGLDDIVWNNLEGDHPCHMYRQFIRTGRYLFFKEFYDSIQHWADVDFCDHHHNPLIEGALRFHSADHITKHAAPCHNWAEGFAAWYYATGDARPLEILRMMADWLLRQDERGFFKVAPQPYVRGCGWGLIQMAAIQDVLALGEIESLIRRLCNELLDYCRKNDGLKMIMPTGGSHVPEDNGFHNSTVAIGAYECWRLYGDDAMRDLALTVGDTLMDDRTCTPEGIAVYITGPEQDFPMQQAAGIALAALAVGYELSGHPRYIRRGMRMLEYCLDRGMIVDHMRIPGRFIEFDNAVILEPQLLMPNSQLLSYQLRGMLRFMKPAHETGMLKQIDYKF